MSSEEEEPGAFSEWLADYRQSRGDLDDSGWAERDLEAAFEAGERAGWEQATEYYGTGGSFK
jgi:hypothetical protein